jgi:hypothetical protein
MGIIKDNVYGRSPSGDGSNELKRDLGIVYTVAGVVFVILIVYVVL